MIRKILGGYNTIYHTKNIYIFLGLRKNSNEINKLTERETKMCFTLIIF